MKKASVATQLVTPVTTNQAREIIESGKIVRVHFIKANGTERRLVGRSGVVKGVSGAGMKYDKNDKGIVVLADFSLIRSGTPVADSYRAVRLDRVLSFRSGGKWYVIR